MPPPPYERNRLGERIERLFVRSAQRFLMGVRNILVEIVSAGLELFLDVLKPVIRHAYGPILAKFRDIPDIPPELKTLFNDALTAEGEAGAAIALFVGQAVGGAVIGSAANSLFANLTYRINRWILPGRPDVATLNALRWRNLIGKQEAYEKAADIGWRGELYDKIGYLLRPRPELTTLALNAWRTGTSLESIRPELRKRGFDDLDIDALFRAIKPIPGPGDLIRMAVREAFTPDIAEKFGLYQDYPAAFGEYMAKQGYSEDWSKRWWAAHWDLPSATAGMEMLHRGIIREDDFAVLLRALDISPYWRKKIEDMSYAPYTRVDVRRMFQVGVIKSREELVRAYKDLGYDDTKAGNLADFTVIEYGESEREATKTDILQAYQIGRLSAAESSGMLADMGYPDWIIQTYLGRVDLARITKTTNEQIGYTKTLYVNGQFSKSDVHTQLGKIPLPATEIERYLDEWEIPRQSKITRPTRTELRKWFVANMLSEADFRQELAGYRLSGKYVDWYVSDAKAELVQTAKAEADKALLEVQRIALARVKTSYDIRSADLDLDIARLKLAQADLKMAITDEMTYEQALEAERQIADAGRQIKVLQVEKASVKSEYVKEKGAI